MIIFKRFLFLSLLFSTIHLFSADRYWIASSDAFWNNTSNWSTSSGGTGGASVPGTSDLVYFDGGGAGKCSLDVDVDVSAIVMSAGTISINTHHLTISGSDNSTFSGGTVQATTTPDFSPTGTAVIEFSGTTFDCDLTVTAPSILLSGSTFNYTTHFENTGTSNATGTGGNTFVGNCYLTLSGASTWTLENISADDFQGNLNIDINSSASGYHTLYIAKSSTGGLNTTVGGSLTATMEGTLGTRRLYIGTYHTLSITGNCDIQTSGTSGSSSLTLGDHSLVTVGGNLTVQNTPGVSVNSSVISIANSTTTSTRVNVTGQTTVTNEASQSGSRVYFGYYGDITCTDNVHFENTGSSIIYVGMQNSSSVVFNEDVWVKGSNDIYFGTTISNTSGGSISLASGKTFGEGTGGYEGVLILQNFTQNGTTSQSLDIGGLGSALYLYNTDWGGNVDFTAVSLVSENSDYHGTAILTQSGDQDNTSSGGNHFYGNLTMKNTGNGQFIFGDGTADRCDNNLTTYNDDSGELHYAESGTGHTITGNCYIYHNSTNSDADARSPKTYLNYNSSLSINGTLLISNEVSGAGGVSHNTDSRIYLSYSSGAVTTVNNSATIRMENETSKKYIYIGYYGDVTFTKDVTYNNNSQSNYSLIYSAYESTSSITYNDNIVVETPALGTDGIYIGKIGSSTLASGKTISIGGSGFVSGSLSLNQFTQYGSTSQTLSTSADGVLGIYHSTFNGPLTVSGPSINSSYNTFNSTVQLTNSNDLNNVVSGGGNVFNGNVTAENTGSKDYKMASSAGNDFNGNLTVTKSGSGDFQPFSGSENTIAGNLTVSFNADVTLGGSSSTQITFDGTAAQSIANSTVHNISFTKLKINNSSDELTLNTPINVMNELDLTAGNINTTSTNYLKLFGATAVNASEDAFVNGPLEYYGNDAITLPVGEVSGTSHIFAPIGIGAASSNNDFTAQYHYSSHSDVDNYSSPLTKVSHIEYWDMNRSAGMYAVDVTLYFRDGSRSGVGNLSTLRVGHYDASTPVWEDFGNDATSGDVNNGSVTANAVNSFSPFTLTTTNNTDNTLPVELLDFSVRPSKNTVLIDWSTASESNSDYFVVERSKGDNLIEKIGTINAKGNSSVLNSYQLTDNKPYTGISYYRLVQYDVDGNKKIYDWKAVSFSQKEGVEINVLPNPSNSNDINLTWEGMSGATLVEVYDNSGRKIHTEQLYLKELFGTVKLHLPLQKGIYHILLINGQNRIKKKLIEI